MYVGISNRPKLRMVAHKCAASVPDIAELIVVDWFKTRREAMDAERHRILDKRPPLNIIHMKGRREINSGSPRRSRRQFVLDEKMERNRKRFEELLRSLDEIER